ncbi:MAG: hypothetical protein HYV15_04755 [Elusimicrobia bacterium]|nr:hypothetical protein [Elusimicrobiota bacterium]
MTAASLALALGAAAWAGGSPSGAGRGLSGPSDPAFNPVLERLERRLPAYEAVEAASVQVPARTIELGLNAKMYRCWKLKLTGDHGRQALAVFERLRSAQEALKDLKGRLSKDLVEYAAAPKPDPELQGRIREAEKGLDSLLDAFEKSLEAAARNGLLKSSDGVLGAGRRTLSPLMTKDDYTMVRDEESPECRKN